MRASLSNAAINVLIDNGVARSRLEQPWISMQENKGVCGGFGIGRDVCCRMLRCLLPDAPKNSALEELRVQVGPNGIPMVGAPPFEVFK